MSRTGVAGPRRLQRLRGATPCDSTEVGRSLARCARALLGEALGALDCGFQDGGCLAFARGVGAWSGNDLVPRAFRDRLRPGAVQHATACFRGELFVDSDGVGTAADVAAKLEALEPGRGFHACPHPFPGAHGLVEHPGLSALVAEALGRDLGPYSPDLLAWLTRPRTGRGGSTRWT